MFKKILIVAIFFAVIATTNCFAYSDVNTDNEYYTQIHELSDSGIINGYEDGSFKPANKITRSEFSKIFCVALNINECTGKSFYDIENNFWAKEYIDALSSAGIINGFEDESFRPEDNILIKDAVKMVVCAKGLERIAEKNGGYPHGYIKTATTYQLLENIAADTNAELTREQAAVLLYNARRASFYFLSERVYGDYYNGYLHIGSYPESWQGVANDSERFDIKPNVFRKTFPYELKVTTDGINYHTTIKSDSGISYELFDLPADKPYIDSYHFDLETGSFVALDNNANIIAYSYDLKLWHDGKPTIEKAASDYPEPKLENIPLDSSKDKIIAYRPGYDPVIAMEISEINYADQTYYTDTYITHISRSICISRDRKTWTTVILPDNVLYATSIYLNLDYNSFVVSCEVPLTDDDKKYVGELEKEAAAEGKIYNIPMSKTENYMIPFEDIV